MAKTLALWNDYIGAYPGMELSNPKWFTKRPRKTKKLLKKWLIDCFESNYGYRPRKIVFKEGNYRKWVNRINQETK